MHGKYFPFGYVVFKIYTWNKHALEIFCYIILNNRNNSTWLVSFKFFFSLCTEVEFIKESDDVCFPQEKILKRLLRIYSPSSLVGHFDV